MNNKYKISVVMPVYNTKEEYLREAIESILNQSFTNYEFIIINDGSTNNAEEVILSYKDERIIYIKQENQGVAKSLNNGIDIAQGEYIARMDSDDVSFKERFAKQVEYLDKNPQVSILGSWYERFPKKKIISLPESVKYLDVLNTCPICHPTVMMRKSELDKYNLKYNPEYKSEDYELWSRAIKYLNIRNLPEILLKYRWHENNICRKKDVFVDADRNIRQKMFDFLTDNRNLRKKIAFFTTKENIKYEPLERIFSIKNSPNKQYKILTVLGFHFYLAKKEKKQQTMNIVFNINHSYVDKLCVCMRSILENNRKSDIKVYVLHSDLTENDKDLLINLGNKYRNFEIKFLPINSDIFKDFKINIDYISIETYYRYLIANLIKDDKCLYLDADIIVRGDISKFYQTDIENYLCAGVKDLYIEKINHKKSIELDKQLYINAGVILFNLRKIRTEGFVEKLLENSLGLQNKIKFQDQDIINITFAGKILGVNSIYNFCSINAKKEKIKRPFAKIIHYTGKVKPWDEEYKGSLKKEWLKYDKIANE